MPSFPASVVVREVGLRDGLQSIAPGPFARRARAARAAEPA